MNCEKGILFDAALQKTVKKNFYYVDLDQTGTERLFFDNSGGALRLKAAVEAKAMAEALPDCPERSHAQAQVLNAVVQEGTKDILSCVFRTEKGALITELTASQTMFHMVSLIMENVPGTNAVVSVLEHPSSFDAVAYSAKKQARSCG